MGVKTCASDAGGFASSLFFGACSGVLSLLKGLDSGEGRNDGRRKADSVKMRLPCVFELEILPTEARFLCHRTIASGQPSDISPLPSPIAHP